VSAHVALLRAVFKQDVLSAEAGGAWGRTKQQQPQAQVSVPWVQHQRL
jgi:hypothetical protein